MPRIRRISWLTVFSMGCAAGLLMAAVAIADDILGGPVPESSAERTVAVFARHVATGRERELTAFAVFNDWRARNTSFEQLSGYQLATVNALGEPAPQTLQAAEVTADFFATLDAMPSTGRGFTASNEDEDANVCVISDALWRTRFGASPSTIGSSIHVESVNRSGPSGSLRIVGIAPRSLRFPERVDIWTPLVLSEYFQTSRAGQWFGVVGRLRAKVPLEQANAEMSSIMSAVQADWPGQQPAHNANLVRLNDVLTERYRGLVTGLAVTAAVLLLVVAASAGGLLAARALGEQVSDRIKLSLGASARRLIAGAAREGALGGLAAFAIAIPVALASLNVFNTLAAELFGTALSASLTDRSAVVGLICAIVLSGTLAALVKGHSLRAVRMAGPWPNRVSLGATRSSARLRSSLIVGEVALSVCLLAAAADLLSRVEGLRAVDLGFETERLLTVRVALPPARYAGARASDFYGSLLERIRALPAVENAALSSDDPLFGLSANPEFTLQFENRVLTAEERTLLLVNGVTDGYFDVLGVSMLEGQPPVPSATSSGELQAVVNQSVAARLFPNEQPIGHRFRFGGRNPPWWTIVGIVADARNDGPLAPPKLTVYLPYPAFGKSDMTLLVKTTAAPHAVTRDIRSIVTELDRNLPLGRIAAATDLVEARFADLRIGGLVMAMLAAAALLLTGLGLYGVLTAIAVQGRREIGLRIALGAHRSEMVRLIFGRAAALVASGVVLGVLGTTIVGLALQTIVPVEAPKVTHMLTLAAIVSAVALCAAARPAWRAVGVDPMETLRAE